MKKNKKRINGRYLKIIKDEYFNGMKAPEIAKKYGYELNFMIKYLNSRATKTYIAPDGIRWRRCSVCRIYRLESEYSPSTSKKLDRIYLTAQCKMCDSQIKKNKYILQKNIGEGRKKLRTSREVWFKNKWKYNTRRKVLKIIGYLNVNGKIIKK